MSTYNWVGLEFSVYDNNTNWNDVGGLYIFAAPNKLPGPGDPWWPLYVGRTRSFRSRIPSHEMWSAAVEWGATHIHALAEEDARERALLERLLIDELKPMLNDI